MEEEEDVDEGGADDSASHIINNVLITINRICLYNDNAESLILSVICDANRLSLYDLDTLKILFMIFR